VIRAVGALAGCLLLGAGVGLVTSPVAAAQEEQPAQPRAWILVDAESGTVLDGGNHHEALPPASAVKLMTALTALQRLKTEDDVTISPRAADAPSPRLGISEGSEWQQQDLVQAMLLSSANDAAYALAEGAAGSLEQFATEMAALGQRMGLEESTFADPAGLDDESAFNGGSTMSAYDLAIVARNVLADPELSKVVALLDYRVTTPTGEETGLRNNGNLFLTRYPGATGMKSGFTSKAGNTLVASAARDGRTMIAVVLNAEDPIGFAAGRLDAGFASQLDEKGSRERLPEPRVTTAQGRLQALAALPRALGRPSFECGLCATGPGAPVASAPSPSPAPKQRAPQPDGGGGRGFPLLGVVGVLMATVFGVAAMLRHRAVQRRELRRLAAQRSIADARRRGTLDIIETPATEPTHVRVLRE
jgi:serine-type D-Ala-D-Ala carboxypeptidase (penicillin-binding protein 5/6)